MKGIGLKDDTVSVVYPIPSSYIHRTRISIARYPILYASLYNFIDSTIIDSVQYHDQCSSPEV
jgi:hypothetical protein